MLIIHFTNTKLIFLNTHNIAFQLINIL